MIAHHRLADILMSLKIIYRYVFISWGTPFSMTILFGEFLGTFDQIFDEIFGQGFDQGLGEANSHKYNAQYFPAEGKHLKNSKNSKNL